MAKEKRRPVTEEDRELGRRMRAAAKAAGFKTQEAMAQALTKAGQPKTQAGVGKWYLGERRPGIDDLRVFAHLVGKDVYWFALPEQENPIGAEVVRTVASIFERVMEEAMPLGDALNQETVATGWLSPELRRTMNEHAPKLRAYLRRQSPRAWESLTATERRELLEAVVRPWVDRELAERLGLPGPAPGDARQQPR